MTDEIYERTANSDLKEFVYADKSKIHGTGLFAAKKIAKGDYIGTYFGPKAKRDGTYVLWVTDENDTVEARSGKNLLRFLNHKEKGNAEFYGFDLYAKKNIRKHDEITFNYEGDE